MSTRDGFRMYVIYDHPRDFPESYVARRWAIGSNAGALVPVPDERAIVSPSIDALRVIMEGSGLTRLERHPDDDTAIVETWL